MKRTHPTALTSWRLTEVTVTRRHLAGDRPVLMVKAVYPRLAETETTDERTVQAPTEAAARFNDAYERAAECFLSEGLTRMGAEAEAAYCALSSEARGMFLRWTLTCRMTAELSPSEGTTHRVQVTTLRSLGRGKRGETVTREVCRHTWRFPEGILEGK